MAKFREISRKPLSKPEIERYDKGGTAKPAHYRVLTRVNDRGRGGETI